MSLTREDPELQQPIEDETQLADFIRAGEKSTDALRVGTEHEKVGIYADTLGPVPYSGQRGIAELLAALEKDHGFDPLLDGENLVGLERDGASITLEPGGQLELSGAPLSTLHETCREFNDHIALMKRVSEPFGIVWLGLGIQPAASLDALPRMPRERYELMREHLAQSDDLGLWMMHGTGTVQANFDFTSEADAATKLRIGQAASPIITALYANSAISGGVPNGFESRRAWIWRHTDGDRCGFLPFVFEDAWLEGDAYRQYAEWALDVPMLFIVRDQHHVTLGGRSFREYLARGYGDGRATLSDWNLHLTTLFPEARLKRILEVRGADAVPPSLVCALPAFWKGLFYDETSREAALERIHHWTWAQVDELHASVSRTGLGALGPDGPVLDTARELVDLSAAGLARIDACNRRGENETLFLEPLYEILDRGQSPARRVLDLWEGAWDRRLDRLVEYARY